MATTKTDPKLALAANGAKKNKVYEGLTREQLIQAYRFMYTSRRIDDREILLKRQQKIYFQMSGAGHEAIGVAAGLALKPGYDWFYPYYRDRALCLALGVKPYEMFLQGVGAANDPSSGGRQMPSHWSYPNLHIVTQSSPTGSQILQAVGCAEGGRYFTRHAKAAPVPDSKFYDYRQFKNVTFQGDEISYVSLGDGTSSEGEFWEAMNAAALGKLPVIFCVEDNGYAISVPVEVQTAGGSISRLVSGLSTCMAKAFASLSLRLRKVGGMSSPPLRVAAIPITACSGATDRPWPKAMVTVLSSPQCLGTIGSALSGNSVRSRSSWPIFFKYA